MQVTIRPLAKADLAEADRIFRLAFGTFVSLPDPMSFAGTADYVRSRWLADPSAAFGAYNGDDLVGSSFSANWGSFGVFGPVTVRPDFWDKGVAKRLLDAAMALFDEWRVRRAALLTFPQSPKHIALYQKFGFWPQFLTAIMSKAVDPPRGRRNVVAVFAPLSRRAAALPEAVCRSHGRHPPGTERRT
jgi:GNAT superfamily N-acetyltransferase